MRKLAFVALLALSTPALADHMDVIEFKLKDGCSFNQYMAVVSDFNAWAKDHGYRAEVAAKIQHADLTTMIWLGRSADAATFGKAWDTWRDAQANADSAPARLQARFAACSSNVGRRSYDTY
jgi:glutamate synthase domain-containing protein 1